jgi:hypothetical protein
VTHEGVQCVTFGLTVLSFRYALRPAHTVVQTLQQTYMCFYRVPHAVPLSLEASRARQVSRGGFSVGRAKRYKAAHDAQADPLGREAGSHSFLTRSSTNGPVAIVTACWRLIHVPCSPRMWRHTATTAVRKDLSLTPASQGSWCTSSTTATLLSSRHGAVSASPFVCVSLGERRTCSASLRRMGAMSPHAQLNAE